MLRLLAAGAAGPLVVPAQPRKPNLLMILVDDMGWADPGFNGRKEWTTPNLDRLAREGTVFDRWYTSMPLCAPSRACLLTGKYTIHNGVRNNATDIPKSETTIAEAVKPLGYTTALIGKWHRGKLPDGSFTHPLDQGFDSTFGYLDARHAWEHFPKQLWRGRESVPVEGYSSDILSDEAAKFIRGHRADPFFLYLAFIEPHFLIEAPAEDVGKFRGRFREKDPAEPYNARYAAMIHRLDAGIGRVLDSLDETGLARDTLIVFSSDNGATFEAGNKGASNYHDSNHPFRGQKRSLEEGGLRMPAVVRWPGRVPSGRRSPEITHMTDVMPSMLAAAGGKPDPAWKVDGRNMLDVWSGKVKAPERTLFWEWQTEGGTMLAAMRGDYKYLDIGGNKFLYNVRTDPGERRSLIGEYPEIMKQLEAETTAWLATAVTK
ncbi:MAG: sulfatase-like hydrolase/transferase [Acidobacteria bacterium]|nr:sulfatase-like hydrolase/transferase [Acidobacteriota bacterium]